MRLASVLNFTFPFVTIQDEAHLDSFLLRRSPHKKLYCVLRRQVLNSYFPFTFYFSCVPSRACAVQRLSRCSRLLSFDR